MHIQVMNFVRAYAKMALTYIDVNMSLKEVVLTWTKIYANRQVPLTPIPIQFHSINNAHWRAIIGCKHIALEPVQNVICKLHYAMTKIYPMRILMGLFHTV